MATGPREGGVLEVEKQKVKPPPRDKTKLEAFISKPFTQSVLL